MIFKRLIFQHSRNWIQNKIVKFDQNLIFKDSDFGPFLLEHPDQKHLNVLMIKYLIFFFYYFICLFIYFLQFQWSLMIKTHFGTENIFLPHHIGSIYWLLPIQIFVSVIFFRRRFRRRSLESLKCDFWGFDVQIWGIITKNVNVIRSSEPSEHLNQYEIQLRSGSEPSVEL